MTDVISAVAINKVYPDGMKTVAYQLELSDVMSSDALSRYAFEVWDHSYEPLVPAIRRTITNVGIDGNYLRIETDIHEKAAYAIGNYKMDGSFNPFGPGQLGFEDPSQPRKMPPSNGKGPMKGPGKDFGYLGPKPLHVTIHMRSETGEEQEVSCTEWECKELDRFRVRELNGQRYLLYVPENYSPNEQYPLVMFIVDAAARGTYEKGPLVQGDGALIWTERESQDRHPCFVLAPLYGPADILTHDDYTVNDKLYKVMDVIDALVNEYSIDTRRIYATGQSMGCMSSCQLMIERPDLFAGAMLVAGQWEPVKSADAIKDKRIWILVSENDMKAHPGMDAITDEIENLGVAVAHYSWDAKAPHVQLEAEAGRAADEEGNIKYTVFQGDSVVPEGVTPSPGSNHTCTWQVAYDITPVRDWLLNE